ncbi:MAG: flavin reductase [Bacteroidales bacterium]|nr:flavin reductase [Bacteroidales bacterium]
MIDLDSLLRVPYGLAVVCSGDKQYGNGFIATVVFQITAEPVRFGVSCNKDNHTAELIKQKGVFSISLLPENTSVDVIRTFGYKSGKDLQNKMEQKKIKHGYSDVPVFMDNVVSYMTCKLEQTVDVGTHLIFIGEVMEAEEVNSQAEVMTYAHYQKVMKGKSPKNAPTYINKSKK